MTDNRTLRSTPRRRLSSRTLLAAAVAATAGVLLASLAGAEPVGARVEPSIAEAAAAALAGPAADSPSIVPAGARASSTVRRIEAPVPGCLIGPGALDVAHSVWVDEPVIGSHAWLGHKIVANPAKGPNGPAVVVADSLGRQSAFETVEALRAAGWGPVCFDAAGGRQLSAAEPGISSGLTTIARIRNSDPLWAGGSVKWVIALGTNDARPGLDVATAQAAIASARTAIGPVGRPVAWVTVATTRGGEWAAPEALWNVAVTSADNVEIVRFADAVATGWLLGDGVHLTPTGIAGRAALIAAVATA